jgi:hypothetical protein
MIQSVTDFVLSAWTVCDFIFTNHKETRRGQGAVDIQSGMRCCKVLSQRGCWHEHAENHIVAAR